MRYSKSLPVVWFLSVIIAVLSAQAGSFSLSEQSVSGLGAAFANGAAAEDASVLFFNPAGVALLEQGEFQLGTHFIVADANFNNNGSRYTLPGTPIDGLRITGNNGGQAGVPHPIPNFYVTQPIFRSGSYGDLSVGLGVSVPFGLETNYDRDWVGRYASQRTKLTTFDFQPTVAYRMFDRLSFGASLDVQRASARLSQAIDFGLAAQQPLGQFYGALPAILAARGIPAAAIPGVIASTRLAYANAGFVPGGRDGVSEIAGDDWSVGYTLGAMFEYLKRGDGGSFLQDGRIGVSYRSAIDHTLEGDADFRRVPLITAPGAPVQFPSPTAFQDIFFRQSATAALDLPDIVRVSAYQRFAQQFAIMGDVTWTHWDRLQTVPIIFSNAATPASVLTINYQNTARYAVGLEWYASKKFTFRTGFAYDETPIRSEQFRTPRIPDNDRYFVSAGLRWTPLDNVDVDLGYAHLFVDEPRSEFNDGRGHLLSGSYDAQVNIISAAVTLRWGGGIHVATETSAKDVASFRK